MSYQQQRGMFLHGAAHGAPPDPRYAPSQQPDGERRPAYVAAMAAGAAPTGSRNFAMTPGGFATGYVHGRPGDEPIDIKEMMKRQMFSDDHISGASQSVIGSSTHVGHPKKNLPNPNSAYGFTDHHVVLDSFHKVEDSETSKGRFRFNFRLQGETTDQDIGVHDEIKNVISIKLAPFCMSIPQDYAYSVAVSGLTLAQNSSGGGDSGDDTIDSPMSQLPFCRRMFMYFRELGSQAFHVAKGGRYHFECVAGDMDPSRAGMVEFAPPLECENFVFGDPIQYIQGITMHLTNGAGDLDVLPDCYYSCTAIEDGSNFLQLATGLTAEAGIAEGDRVFITGFNAIRSDITSDGAALSSTSQPNNAVQHHALNNYINRVEGHIIGSGGLISSTGTFRLHPDVNVASAGTTLVLNHTSIGGTSVHWPALDTVTTALDRDRQSSTYNTYIPTTTTEHFRIKICVAKRRLRIPLVIRGLKDEPTNYKAP